MQEFAFSYQNIIDGQGFSLAVAGMTIVFVALIAVSLLITLLPRILRVVNRYYPELDGLAGPTSRGQGEGAPGADDEAMAASAAALHAHRQARR